MNGGHAESQTPPRRGSENREDQRFGKRTGQTGAPQPGERAEDLAVRTARTARAWANIALDLAGGILSQLVEQARDQLAYHQDSVTWYQEEVKKAESGAQWHAEQLKRVETQLEKLEELTASLSEIEALDDD